MRRNGPVQNPSSSFYRGIPISNCARWAVFTVKRFSFEGWTNNRVNIGNKKLNGFQDGSSFVGNFAAVEVWGLRGHIMWDALSGDSIPCSKNELLLKMNYPNCKFGCSISFSVNYSKELNDVTNLSYFKLIILIYYPSTARCSHDILFILTIGKVECKIQLLTS